MLYRTPYLWCIDPSPHDTQAHEPYGGESMYNMEGGVCNGVAGKYGGVAGERAMGAIERFDLALRRMRTTGTPTWNERSVHHIYNNLPSQMSYGGLLSTTPCDPTWTGTERPISEATQRPRNCLKEAITCFRSVVHGVHSRSVLQFARCLARAHSSSTPFRHHEVSP